MDKETQFQLALDKHLQIEFTKPHEDLIKFLDEIAETGRICHVEARDKDYLVYVEKTCHKTED